MYLLQITKIPAQCLIEEDIEEDIEAEVKEEVQGEVVGTTEGTGEEEVVEEEEEEIHRIQHLGHILMMKTMKAWVMKKTMLHLSQDCM